MPAKRLLPPTSPDVNIVHSQSSVIQISKEPEHELNHKPFPDTISCPSNGQDPTVPSAVTSPLI